MQDLRFALRQLLTHRAFAVTALLVLTLGIGGSVAIFGFVDAALIRPLPYHDPSRLVTLFAGPPALQNQTRGSQSYLDLVEWRARTQAFESVAGFDVRGGFTLTTASGPERVSGLRVTSGFFRTLGVTPILGRDFLPHEEGRSAPPTAVLSYTAWQTRFGGRPDVLGQTVTLQSSWLADPEPHVIVGVLPKDFHFTMANHAEFWATIRRPQACWDVRSCRSLEIIARRASATSEQAAAANLTTVVEQLRKEYPEEYRSPEIGKLMPLREVLLGNVRPMLLMLLGGAGLLLTIGCINVVSLLLARSESRARETAVRQALGASTSRLIQQFATEALLLTTVATALGLILAQWIMQLLKSMLSVDMISRMPYLELAGLNPRLVIFAATIALVAGAAFAMIPIVRLSIARAATRLNDGSRGSAGIYWRRFGSHLVVAELAVAVLLLISAGLLSKGLYRLLTTNPGFNTQGLAAISVTPVTTRLPPSVFAQRVAERAAALPGVASVGYADQLPLGAGLAPSSVFWIVGRAEGEQVKNSWPVRRVSATYFSTLQARLSRGRYFTEEEVSAARRVIIINESAARRYFPGDDPIGRSIAFGSAASPAREIVGIIADITDGPPETPPHPSGYVPFDQSGFALVLRTPTADRSFATQLQAAIREVQSDVLIGSVTTMAERVDRLPSTTLQRASAWLIGGFAATAFVLSVVGLYGVVAYSVGQRRREIGVRMALGAQPDAVYRLVMGEASRLVALGTVLGILAAVSIATMMRHLLFGVASWDPPTLLAAATVLSVAALLASYIPARRAASVNPIEVLRAE